MDHVICVCQETMKKELRKVGVGEITLKSIITYGVQSLFCYLKRKGLIK